MLLFLLLLSPILLSEDDIYIVGLLFIGVSIFTGECVIELLTAVLAAVLAAVLVAASGVRLFLKISNLFLKKYITFCNEISLLSCIAMLGRGEESRGEAYMMLFFVYNKYSRYIFISLY